MRNKLFSKFIELKFKCSYFEEYWSYAKRVDSVITFFCTAVSLSSIASWAVWQQLPILWGILIAAAQVVQAAKPHLPYADRLSAMKYANPELQEMLIDFEYVWNALDLKDTDDETLNKKCSEFTRRYRAIYVRYLGNDNIPMQQRIHNKAEKKCKEYFSTYYNTQEWRETNARKETAAASAEVTTNAEATTNA